MKILICGLGYVGVTAAACLVGGGHDVVGIDVDPRKVGDVAAGRSPVSEPGVAGLLARGAADGRLSAAQSVGAHLVGADIALVCVGTPSSPSGALETRNVGAVAAELGKAIAALPPEAKPPLIVMRSTLPPGTMDSLVLPTLAAEAGPPGDAYEVAFNPEFLRESTAIADYHTPSRIVIGERLPGASQNLRGLYDGIDAPVFELSFAAAELVKLADNAFHAIKVTFGNEIGRLALDLGVAPGPLMDAFLADTQLNISPAYLRPGGPFGGSCLPKDVRAINALAASRGISAPLLGSALPSNAAHKSWLADRVMAEAGRGATVLLLGLSFKNASDDLRESPLIDLAETLIGKGYDLRIHDPDLTGRDLFGANLRFVEERLPHLSCLLIDDVTRDVVPDLVVVGKPMPAVQAALDPAWPVIDIARL